MKKLADKHVSELFSQATTTGMLGELTRILTWLNL